MQEIIKEWNLTNKVFVITTDNGANIIKAIRYMNRIKCLPCTSHTLQLVVGKGLNFVKVLIARAKRLIYFFMSSKQSERLVEA